jgi:hypothetical protein
MSTPSVHYKVGFKSGGGGAVPYDGQFHTEEAARREALRHIDAGHGMHYVWKVTMEEVPL